MLGTGSYARRLVVVLLVVNLIFQYGLVANFSILHSRRLETTTEAAFHADLYNMINESSTRIKGGVWPFKSRESVRILLVHLGKAGGMSLYKKLRIRNEKQLQRKLACQLQRRKVAKCKDPFARHSKFGQALLARYHMMARSLGRKQLKYLLYEKGGANLLVFTVRNPFDRLVSAFHYHRAHDSHKDKQVGIFDCFSTIQDLAQSLKQKKSFCSDLAVKLIQGNLTAKSQQHFRYNYQYYAKKIWTDSTKQNVAVVRTEHQWSDMARLEELLGGDPAFFLSDQVQVTHGSEHYAQSGRLISQTDRRAICCILKDELQVYYDLILASANLNATEKEASLQFAQQSCGVNHESLSRRYTTAIARKRKWGEFSCTGV